MIVASKIVHLYNSTFSEQAFPYQSHFMDVLIISLPHGNSGYRHNVLESLDHFSWI